MRQRVRRPVSLRELFCSRLITFLISDWGSLSVAGPGRWQVDLWLTLISAEDLELG